MAAKGKIVQLAESLVQGLRKTSDHRVNGKYLTEAVNLRPLEEGVVSHKVISVPSDPTEAIVTWPFPQFIRGEEVALAAEATEVDTINEATWARTAITTYNAANVAEERAITQGGVWQFADFGTAWFLGNGTDMVIKLPSYDSWKVVVGDVTLVNALARSGNRLYFGGLSSGTYFDGSDWGELWDRWMATAPDDVVTYDGMSIGTNVLAWSAVGGGEYDWPFVAFVAALGLTDTTNYAKIEEAIWTSVQTGGIGFLPMRWKGTIHAIKELGQYTMVYGANGVTAVTRDHQPIDLMFMGTCGRGCVAGTQAEHVFVDIEGTLWHLSADLHLTKLGYKEYLGALTVANIVASYDPEEQVYYFCTGLGGYTLTKTGLGELSIFTSGVQRVGGTLYGFQKDGGTTTSQVVTDSIDFGTRDVKTLVEVQLSGSGIAGATVQINYKFDKDDAYTTTDAVTVDTRGNALVKVSGIQFQIVVNFAARANVNLNDILVTVSDGSKRGLKKRLQGED